MIGRVRLVPYIRPMSSPRNRLSPDEMASIMRALADPRRYNIMTTLAAADAPVACAALPETRRVSASTMSHHLQQLEQAGLVEVSRDGRFAILSFMRDRYDLYLRQLAEDAAPRPTGA